MLPDFARIWFRIVDLFQGVAYGVGILIVIILGIVFSIIGMVFLVKLAIGFFGKLFLSGGMTEKEAMKSMQGTEWSSGSWQSHVEECNSWDDSGDSMWDDGQGGDYRD